MFKKIFHTSAVEKLSESIKSCTLSDSSDSGESEVVSAEMAKPEKRYFLRRPLKFKPGLGDNLHANFRTFDPFDIKSSLRRSSSFPFNSSPELCDSSNAKIPRSKSVHFAEDLTTYHEFKPNISSSLSDMESAFEEYCRMKKSNEGSNPSCGRDSDEGNEYDEVVLETRKENEDEDEDEDEVEVDDEGEGEGTDDDNGEGDGEGQGDYDTSNNTGSSKIAEDEIDCQGPNTKGMQMAGNKLKSVFTEIIPKTIVMDTTRGVGFDTSDSTDVESVGEPEKESEWEFIHSIYEQVCDLYQTTAKDMSGQSIQILKSEVLCVFADLGDRYADNQSKLEHHEIESATLGQALKNNAEQIETQSILISSLQVKLAACKDSETMMNEKNVQVCALENRVHLLERENKEQTLLNKVKADLETDLEKRLQESQKEVSALKRQTKEIELLRKSDRINKYEKNELVAQLNSARKEAEGLQQFQEVERALLQKEVEKAQACADSFAAQVQEKTHLLDSIKSKLTAQKASKEVELTEAKLMIQELGKRYEEKRAQVSTIVSSLERIWPQSKTKSTICQSPNEIRRNSPSASVPKLSSTFSDMELASMLLTKIQKTLADYNQQEIIKTEELENLTRSNRIAMEVLTSLIKGSFDALAPIFDTDCAEQFTQFYYDFSQSQIITEDIKSIIMVLSTFVLNSQRELLRSYQKNEQMLETEIQDRLKYQQQVLDSFTKIVRQVMENTRGPRISGIRGHSSPKKHRAGARR